MTRRWLKFYQFFGFYRELEHMTDITVNVPKRFYGRNIFKPSAKAIESVKVYLYAELERNPDLKHRATKVTMLYAKYKVSDDGGKHFTVICEPFGLVNGKLLNRHVDMEEINKMK